MQKVIGGKVYNTETATRICEVNCNTPNVGDFEWHETTLYRTNKGTYFLAGEGGPMSMWAKTYGNSTSGGSGLRVIDKEQAMSIAEDASLEPEEMQAAGFEVEEG